MIRKPGIDGHLRGDVEIYPNGLGVFHNWNVDIGLVNQSVVLSLESFKLAQNEIAGLFQPYDNVNMR